MQKRSGEGLSRVETITQLQNKNFTENQLSALVHIVEHAGNDPVPPAQQAVEDAYTAAIAAPIISTADVSSTALGNVKLHSPGDRVAKQQAARAQGYTGDMCSNCMGVRVKVSGHCTVCEDCGTTSGCS